MLEQPVTVDVTPLSTGEWAKRIDTAERVLPFGSLPWINLGTVADPELGFNPLAVRWPDHGELLVPLCRRPAGAQIGGFGYGMVYPAAGWRGTALPPFPALAASICATLQLARLHALLPPGDDVVDRWTGGWTTTTGRLTYLLDLTSGLEAVWAGAKGRMRTAVRRARALGVHAAEGEPGQASRLVELYGDTMGRHDVTHRYTEADFRFLLDGSTGSALVTVARDDHGVQAASVFAVGDRTAYHVMQTISAEGRRTNAGYLALWEAITALSHRGIQLVDLGSAAAPGQERFKTDWGGLARPTRLVRWEKEPKP